VEISLTAPPGQAFAALQWEITYSPVQLGLTKGDMVIAGPAKAAGRELVCAAGAVKADSYVYRCVLAGGRQTISKGAIAVVTFHIRPYARPGSTTVEIGAASGVSGDGKQVEIPSSRTEVTIR
jgi:hypothetical protein